MTMKSACRLQPGDIAAAERAGDYRPKPHRVYTRPAPRDDGSPSITLTFTGGQLCGVYSDDPAFAGLTVRVVDHEATDPDQEGAHHVAWADGEADVANVDTREIELIDIGELTVAPIAAAPSNYARPDGYSVWRQDWTESNGQTGSSWVIERPNGDILENYEGSEVEAWEAARVDAADNA